VILIKRSFNARLAGFFIAEPVLINLTDILVPGIIFSYLGYIF
jgi:hypothetical protein